MKTTMEINDELLKRARAVSRRENTTLRGLVEQGLRQVLRGRRPGSPRKPRMHVFGGKTGFTEDFQPADWAAIKEEARRR